MLMNVTLTIMFRSLPNLSWATIYNEGELKV